MSFDWSTFFLEILNFLILIWLLQHFLFRPVLKVVDERQRRIQMELEEVEQERAQSQLLKETYESELKLLDVRRKQALLELEQEIARERELQLNKMALELSGLKTRGLIQEEQRNHEIRMTLESKAIEKATRFLSTMLERLASPELEAGILDVMLDDLELAHEHQDNKLESVLDGSIIKVSSAYPLNDAQRAALERMLKRMSGNNVVLSYVENPSLLSGVRIECGSFRISANLHDELDFFKSPLSQLAGIQHS